jgi:biotin carboxyl carrier protein
VIKVTAGVGDHVTSGDILFVVEAMKMEVEVKAPSDATVSSIVVDAGDQVTAGQVMATLN